PVLLEPLLLVTTTGCDPAATSTGTCAVISPGATYTSGALLPPMVSLVPLNDVGSVLPSHPLRPSATLVRFLPVMVIRPAGADVPRFARLPPPVNTGSAVLAGRNWARMTPPPFTVVCRLT